MPGLTVSGVEAELRDDLDPDEPVVALTVALAEPPDGLDTWPLAAVQELRQLIRRYATDAGVPYTLSIRCAAQ